MNNHKYAIALPLMNVEQSDAFIRNAENINVLNSIQHEVDAQFEKWGEQNHADFVPPGEEVTETRENMLTRFAHDFRSADAARNAVERLAAHGMLTYAAIFREEAAEAIEEAANGDEDKLVTELVQTAAVIVSWIGAIRRRQRDRWAEQTLAVNVPGVFVTEEMRVAAALGAKKLSESTGAVMKTALELAGFIGDGGDYQFDGVVLEGKDGKPLSPEMSRLAEALNAWPNEGRPEAPRDYVVYNDYVRAPDGAAMRTWTRKPETRVITGAGNSIAFDEAKAKPGDIVAFTDRCNCPNCNGGFAAMLICADAILNVVHPTVDEMLKWAAELTEFRSTPMVVTRKSLAN